MQTYEIVSAARQHLREVPRIEQAAATVFPDEDLPSALRYRVTDPDILSQAQKDGRLWIALDHRRQVVGFALAEVLDDEACLDEVDVHPSHMRRGLGTRLVKTVVAWACEQGFPSLALLTFRHLPWNARFYAKLGFAPVAREDLGPELASILEEERRAGINVANRIGMRRPLAGRQVSKGR